MKEVSTHLMMKLSNEKIQLELEFEDETWFGFLKAINKHKVTQEFRFYEGSKYSESGIYTFSPLTESRQLYL